jgi:hypothetical protein
MVEEVKIKKHSGPKTPFKVFMSIILFLSFTFGIVFLSEKRTFTGYAVSEVDKKSWLGSILVAIPLVLVLYWMIKYKSAKI